MSPGAARQSEQRVEAVERALTILNAFADGTPRMGLSALAARTGFYPSTVLRLSASLERFGYLNRDGDGDFRLGPALWRLGVIYQASFNLADYVRPVLETLVEVTGETASFYVREKGKRICLYRHNGPRMVRSHLDEGAELPLDRGAAGHILVAYGAHDTGKGSAMDSGKPSDKDADKHAGQHARIRLRGYAISKGERDPDSTAVAVPIFRAGGILVGALGIVGPRARMNDGACRKALTALKAEASALSQKLGALGT
jgi:DNA-binding IclR family transcriptional regulator